MSGHLSGHLSGLLWLCFAGGWISLLVWQWRQGSQAFKAQKAGALQQFHAWLASPAAAQLHVSSADTNPVLVYESKPGRETATDYYTLTWYLRNGEGQYVMLMSTTSEKPFVKLLEDRYARAALNKRYQPPN